MKELNKIDGNCCYFFKGLGIVVVVSLLLEMGNVV